MNNENKRIPLDAPLLIGNEKKYLNECIDTNWISWQGRFVDKLETDIASYCGTKYGLSIVNGTQALLLALRALNIGQDDEVLVPSFTMSATTFAVSSLGAKIVWVDIDDNSLNIGPEQVRAKISKKTKAIIAVHLYGSPCDVEKIKEVAGDIPIIEDVAESFGAMINGRVVGSIGNISCHSFHNKIIASGEGGAITTNDMKLYEKIKILRTPSEDNSSGTELVLNARMSNIASAIALAQLENIDLLIEKRRDIAKVYDNMFQHNYKIKVFAEKTDHKNVYWRYQIFVDKTVRATLIESLKNLNIETRPVFRLMHKHQYYQNESYLPNSKLLSDTGIDIPTSPAMNQDDASYVADTIIKILDNL